MTSVLNIQDLRISFGASADVVHGLSFALEAGKTLAIVGESGSGKSVSSLAIMGLLGKTAHIQSSKMEFNGQDISAFTETDFRPMRGKQISMIFQEPMTSLNPAMTCGKQVAESLQLHEGLSFLKARSATMTWFEKVKLPQPESVFEKYPHQLSGGQRQRVMIALAMCTSPKLLIADEPTTALDVTVQKDILQLLRDLQKDTGMAMIFITHDLGVVQEIADEVLVMLRGQVQEHGETKQVIEHPKSNYTKGLLACRPPLDSKPKRLPTVQEFLKNDGSQKTDGGNMLPEKQQAATSGQRLLSITDVHKFFPLPKTSLFAKRQKTEVLKGISFDVYRGETVGLVGESGCGKSTLGRNIIRLLTPEKGQIIYNGQDITHLKGPQLRRLRKEIQIIFQDPYSSLNPKQRIGDAITEPMLVHGLHGNAKTRKLKAEELLEKVGLGPEYFNRYPHEFSGGQRQRIGIARALALEPELIICDESVSALDVSVQAQVLNLLNDLKEEYGLTYIFISHDLSVVKYFSDRVAVMNQGEIVELNTSEEIYRNPQDAYTKKLLSSIPAQ